MLRESSLDCWMQTHSGRIFHPLDPQPEEIVIEDIAAALSKICRFCGHVRQFYSVAEHCWHVADYAPEPLKLTALLHDASEAYLADIIRPIKPHLDNYYEIEDRLMQVISSKFGTSWPLPAVIKTLDTRILTDERERNMAKLNVEPKLWGNPLPGLGVHLHYWSPRDAEATFLSAFHQLNEGE